MLWWNGEFLGLMEEIPVELDGSWRRARIRSESVQYNQTGVLVFQDARFDRAAAQLALSVFKWLHLYRCPN